MKKPHPLIQNISVLNVGLKIIILIQNSINVNYVVIQSNPAPDAIIMKKKI